MRTMLGFVPLPDTLRFALCSCSCSGSLEPTGLQAHFFELSQRRCDFILFARFCPMVLRTRENFKKFMSLWRGHW